MAKGTVSRSQIREQLKEDELSVALKRASDFVQRHSRTLILVAVVVIAAVVMWRMFEYRETKAVENSNLQLETARQKYTEALYSPDMEAARRAEMLDESVTTLETIRQTYPGTPASRLALYLQGNAYLAEPMKEDSTEHLEKARETFRQYADTADSKEDKARGLLGLATAYENLGWLNQDTTDYQKAETAYREIVGLLPSASYLVLEAKVSLASLLADQGQVEKAVDLYRDVIQTAEEPENEEEETPALTESDRQRRDFDQQVRSILDRYSYAEVAREKLNILVPSSADTLDLGVPGRKAQEPAASEPADQDAPKSD